MSKTDFDAVVVGSGPNGLAAAITLQRQGKSVLLIEAKDKIGGGLRSEELTLPGFLHDVCSAVHPMASVSPFLKSVPLEDYGVDFIYPDVSIAHPLENGNTAVLTRSVDYTAESLGEDRQAYLDLMTPILEDWPKLTKDILSPLLKIPTSPRAMANFGWLGLSSAMRLSRRFKTPEAKALWAGMSAHSMQPLSKFTTSAVGLVLQATGHVKGWPLVIGGSQRIADALSAYFTSLGGRIETGFYVKSLSQLPSSKLIMFDVTPKQLLEIAGHRFSRSYQWQLRKFRYGMGVFKVDWALDAPIPFTAADARRAGTLHLGNTIEEIQASEDAAYKGRHVQRPFVLLSQPSLFDYHRAPAGKHTAWAYCHVPGGSTVDMKDAIENQVERFAPGFKDRILASHTFNTEQLQAYNPNYIGGDIGGGVMDIRQLFNRPALFSPYRTGVKGIYICSSSTPPGGGVHGMCGFHAANRALKDVFDIKLK